MSLLETLSIKEEKKEEDFRDLCYDSVLLKKISELIYSRACEHLARSEKNVKNGLEEDRSFEYAKIDSVLSSCKLRSFCDKNNSIIFCKILQNDEEAREILSKQIYNFDLVSNTPITCLTDAGMFLNVTSVFQFKERLKSSLYVAYMSSRRYYMDLARRLNELFNYTALEMSKDYDYEMLREYMAFKLKEDVLELGEDSLYRRFAMLVLGDKRYNLVSDPEVCDKYLKIIELHEDMSLKFKNEVRKKNNILDAISRI